MNNIFKQLLLTAAFVFCISMTASAQDGRKPPPKKVDPPRVIVKDDKKPPPKDEKPRNDENRGKKPQAFFLNTENIIGISFV